MKKVLVLLLIPMMSCLAADPKGAKTPMIPTVSVVQPQLLTVTNFDEYPGHLEAVEKVEIRARVSGYLESIHFQDGAEVKAGDLLFVIDPKPYEAEFDRAKAEREQAESRLELANNDYQRAEALKKTHAISDEEFDNRSKAKRQAEAALNAAKANETTAQINLDYTHIKAPISGRIGKRSVTPGNLIQVGGGVLTTIVTMDPMYCYFDANESAFLNYRKNPSGSIPCYMALGGSGEYTRAGVIDFFDNEVNENSGTIRMRAVFKNEDRSLVPGLFVNARVPAGPAAETLFIPDITINSDQGHKYVLIVGKTNTVEIRPIVAGRANGILRAVSGGLTSEDRVIVSGQMMMMPRPGTPVQIAPPAAPAPAK